MTSIAKLQAKTTKAAGDARATGQLSKTAFNAIVDGKVTASDVDRAKKVLDGAKKLLGDIKREGASSTQQGLASRELKIATALYGAVKEQYQAQKGDIRRPPTGGGKGSTRPSTGAGKGSVSRPTRRTVRRPTTSSSKGSTSPAPTRTPVRRPSTSSTKGRPGGK